MEINPQSRKLLALIADISQYNTNASVLDTSLIERSGLPASEVNKYLTELESHELIKRQIKVSGADFRLLNLTKYGLKEL
jgi:predicted transcriptional regulator